MVSPPIPPACSLFTGYFEGASMLVLDEPAEATCCCGLGGQLKVLLLHQSRWPPSRSAPSILRNSDGQGQLCPTWTIKSSMMLSHEGDRCMKEQGAARVSIANLEAQSSEEQAQQRGSCSRGEMVAASGRIQRQSSANFLALGVGAWGIKCDRQLSDTVRSLTCTSHSMGGETVRKPLRRARLIANYGI